MTLPLSVHHRWKYLVIVVVSVLLVYGQTLRFGFVNYDDDELIYKNEKFLSEWSNVVTAFTAHAFIGAGGESIYYRPLHVVTLITDYHLWGLNPFGYHLTNIILHATTAICVFCLMRLLLDNSLSALFTSLIFALHPIQTESVGWIAGRNDILLGLFVVLMMIFYIKSQRENLKAKLHSSLSLIFFTSALFTKESAAFYLLLIPIYNVCFGEKTFKETVSMKNFSQLLQMTGVLLVYFVIRYKIFHALVGAEQMYGKGKPFFERLMHVPAIVIEHLKLLILPINLSVAHPLTDIIWLAQPWYFVSILLLLAFVVTLWWSRQKNPTLFFGLVWLAVGLLPVLNLIPMPKPILEHRLYVPMVGAALSAGNGIDSFSIFIRSFRMKEYTFVILIIILSLWSYLRLPIWRTGITLFTDAVEKAPSDLHSNYSLARAYYDEGLYTECLPILDKYLILAPTDPRGYRFLREVYYVTGRRQEVATLCKRMITLQPGNPQRYLEAGVIYEELNQPDTAAFFYRQGLFLDSSVAELHLRLGIVEEQLGQLKLAEKSFKQAIVLNIQDAEAYLYLAKLYTAEKDKHSAIQILESGIPNITPTIDYLRFLNDLYNQSGKQSKSQELRRRFKF
jgi:tetratricopeptide (TPR) repeat protein